MTFSDAFLWQEIEEAGQQIGLDEQVLAFVEQSFVNDPGFTRRKREEFGPDGALRMNLALLHGLGIIDAEFRYHGPIPGRTGPEYGMDGLVKS